MNPRHPLAEASTWELPTAGLVLLMVLKIALDVRAHLRQHTRLSVDVPAPA